MAANYAGNDAAAQQFQIETGIPVFKWDVGDYAACEQGVAQVVKELGPVDVLVNNAGITRDAMRHRMTKEQWDAVVRTDLDSIFNMCRQVIESMRNRSFGRIINVSSINGRKGQMGQTNYSAAKAGVHGFTKALAFEGAAKGITVNTIAPGYIATEMTAHNSYPMPFLLSADEVKQILYRQATSADRPRPKLTFEKNETVRINEGPFANFSGKIDEVNLERNTVRVLVTIFGRATPVELDFLQVEKI